MRNAETTGRKLSNREIRALYDAQVKSIPQQIDRNRSLEEQARQAHALRAYYRTQARDMMQDQAERELLDIDRPALSFEALVEDKMRRKRLTQEEAYEDIIQTAKKTNRMVNTFFGLGGEDL